MAGICFFCVALLSCPRPAELLLAVAVHEAAHALAAFLLGWGAPSVCLRAAGFRLAYFGEKGSLESICVSLSGCAVGLIMALLPLPFAFRLYCLGLSLLNLLPVRGLDGWGALYRFLLFFLLPHRAYGIANAVSLFSALALWAGGVFLQLRAGVNVTLLLVCVYLTVTALSDG